MCSTTLSIERNPISAQNQTFKILQSIYFAYKVGIISSYSHRMLYNTLKYTRHVNPYLSAVSAEDSKVVDAHRSSTIPAREPRLVSMR